jgi:hypothetical protein
VISEIEIWRAANLLLKHYGRNAGAEAAARAAALKTAGDREGEAVWRRDLGRHLAAPEPDAAGPFALTDFST